MTTALLLPAALFLKRFHVQQWGHETLASAAAFTLLLILFVVDGLINAFPNILYVIAAGGLASIASGRARPDIEKPMRSVNYTARVAAQYRDAGRALKDQGRFAEAKSAWLQALGLLNKGPAGQPDHLALDQGWCDCANNLAWLVATTSDSTVRDPVLALSLASRATRAHPMCGDYWNTLGVAQYCAGDYQAAITTLGQSIKLNEGGTAFDFFFLAMAHAQIGAHDIARHWFREGALWMDRHAPDHPELVRFRDEAWSLLPPLPEASVAAQT
jgi:tetratricopeptide (TPR) repeat protein